MASYNFERALSSMARERLEISEIGEMIRLVKHHGAISFTAGEPSADLMPALQLKEAFGDVFDDPSLLGYAGSVLGYPDLREWIRDWMRDDGLLPDWVVASDIMITCGSQEGLSLAGEALIDPGSYVLVESPTYMEALLSFRKQGAVCVGVPTDEHGIVVEPLETVLKSKNIRFLYSIPNFQNPSGYTASAERRIEVLDVLRKYDVPILEDDPYHHLSYDGETPPTYIKLSGGDARVVYLGSFSKIVAPGIRCGWMIAPASLMTRISSLRVNACLDLPSVLQRGLLNYLSRIDVKAHIEGLNSVYRRRRDALLSALDRHMGGMGFTHNRPGGGFFVWGNVDGIADMTDFARYAVASEKVGVIPGSVFFAPGAADQTSIRLSFAKNDEAQSEEGCIRLARAVKNYRKGSL
ncbi:MAG: PLP-dependent aminotransferase family protein [Synergistaceae bacterium]|jgi:2-aminoadipate transaminase|nr:PLP-dependent aminotransferase family protein [Synergistaceae bacterium]